jgi:hypothetical protein
MERSPESRPDRLTRRLMSYYFRALAGLRGRPVEFVVVLGLMRSRSTLLAHILNSSPEIAFVGELHRSYLDEDSLFRMIADCKRLLGEFDLRERYVGDKILHNEHVVDDSVLMSSRVRWILLTREPVGVISSMDRAGWMKKLGEKRLDAFADYYVRRLRHLESYATTLAPRGRVLHVDADDLVQRSSPTLAALTSFLRLGARLSEDYRVHERSGARGIGDPSENIRAGTIVKQKTEPLELPPPVLEAVRAAHDGFARHLHRLGVPRAAADVAAEVQRQTVGA